jgi:hypothetical protein
MERLKVTLFSLCLIFAGGTAYAQDYSHVEQMRMELRKQATVLDSLYKKCTAYPDSSALKFKFFEKFPSDFHTFDLIYGFPNDEPGVLYDSSGQHVMNLFNKLDCCIPDEKYYAKLIEIGIDGKWEADGVSFIQYKIREKVLQKPLVALGILTKLKTQKVESFFFFFFNEPHPIWKSVPEELNIIKKHNPKIYGIIEKSFKAALKQSGH